MKKLKKLFAVLISLLLVISLTFTASAVTVSDYEAENGVVKIMYNIVEGVLEFAVNKIADFFPTPSAWTNGEIPQGFMPGTENFTDSVNENSKWLLGYDSRSILPEDENEIIGKLYIGGSIAFNDKTATSVVDDLKVRTFALNDSNGTGTAVFAVIDAYGLSLSDVRQIRTRLEDFAKENNINSITVSVLHQHSAVDTFGMNGNIAKMILLNPFKVWQGLETENGKDPQYMENLYETCVSSVEAAVNSMVPGKLYKGSVDASKYIRDKRQPYVSDPDFTRLRFVPDNGGKETWIITSNIHCVGNGAAGTDITGDYPYYAEEVINSSADANVAFVLGAEMCLSQERNENTVENYSEDMTRLETMAGFGKSIGSAILTIKSEKEVAPILNIRYEEIRLTIDNPVLLLAGKAGLFDNVVVKEGDEYKVVTEIGYMELGEDMAFAVIPGELAPEIAYGGALTKEYSWSGKDWEYPSFEDIISDTGRELYVLGLSNDQIAYIVPDNDYMPMIYDGSQSVEFVSLGKNTGSSIVNAFKSVATAE